MCVPDRNTDDTQKDGQKDGKKDGNGQGSSGTGKTGKTGKTGTTNKDERDEALYVEPPRPNAEEVGKYEQVCFLHAKEYVSLSIRCSDHEFVCMQWKITRVDVPEDEKKRAKPFWSAYYTIQNVGSSNYAWSEDKITSGGTPVVEHESPRIWAIDVVAKNPKTSKDESLYVASSVVRVASTGAASHSR